MKGITDTMDNTTKKAIFLDIDGTLAIPGETAPVPSAPRTPDGAYSG